jgi:ParB-like chromosome segregation protein Spo0J
MKTFNQDANQAGLGQAKHLQVIYRPIGELKPDPANPRLHAKKQIRQIANSVRTFGFNVPVLTDADST